ncbi:uncharacterized protein LOC109843375 [Asparagus officinalis]|uniref:uncharacterized protein LOC109843375 n=1 Tax=Asparagus officinalis TaxID=4686 RepID=UPI00098E07F9|nr:uncharacterized protein LOC109843375 [Asparagus officinalis]
MCCCPSRVCCLCFLLVLVVALIGFVFGFGVFAHGFHKLKEMLHDEPSIDGRPFLGFGVPAPAPL